MRQSIKLTLSALCMHLLLAGCINEYGQHEVQGDIIKFNTNVSAALTRAGYTDATFTAFRVTALGDNSPYFQNLEVVRQSDATWQTEATKYWPAYPLHFFGYAPSTLQSQVSINSDGQQITSFTQAAKPSEQTDVLTAYVLANRNSNNGAAVLDFRHTLSQVEVKAKNGSSGKYTVEVIGVKLGRIPSTADMNFQIVADGYPVWLSPVSPQDFILKGTSPVTLNETEQSIMFGSHNFLMIPQTLLPWTGTRSDNGGAYLSVLCRIRDELGNCIYPSDASKYGFAALPIKETWEPGHKYTYEVAFFTNGGGAGRVDPDPANPENDDDPDVDPVPGGPDKQGGDLVVPDSEVPISVTVGITDWLTTSSDNIDMEF